MKDKIKPVGDALQGDPQNKIGCKPVGVALLGDPLKNNRGITLIALIITNIVPYDKNVKCCNL